MKKDKMESTFNTVAKFFNIDYDEFNKLPLKKIRKYMAVYIFRKEQKEIKSRYFAIGLFYGVIIILTSVIISSIHYFIKSHYGL